MNGARKLTICCSDNWISKGQYPGIKEGAVLGSDCVGVVVSDDPVWKGKRVVVDACVNWTRGNPASPPGPINILGMPVNGTFADQIVIPKLNIRGAPEYLTDVQAAAFPLAGVTAYRALVTKGHCKEGSTVLVTGIGGGVAVFAVQIAKALGAKVYVTSSSNDKIERAKRELGALGGANYKNENWTSELLKETNNQKFDIIIDGAGDIASLIKVVKGGGKIVNYGATGGATTSFVLAQLFITNSELLGTAMGSPEDFDGLIDLMNKTKIVPVVDEVFPFENFHLALDKMRKASQFGKLVLQHRSRSGAGL